MRPDIVPGGVFPDYELPDHTNVQRKLSELLGDDRLILTFVRGHYRSLTDWARGGRPQRSLQCGFWKTAHL